jgi:Glycine cleavage H-protein
MGGKIKKGEPILSIVQNGKRLQINAPISGTINEQNEALISDSSLLNNSPYNDGWVYLVEPTNWLKEIQFLIMEKKYKEWLRNEFTRLKDFIAAYIKPDTLGYQQIILQDGGAISDGFLADFSPEIWEDFQKNFIDTSLLA